MGSSIPRENPAVPSLAPIFILFNDRGLKKFDLEIAVHSRCAMPPIAGYKKNRANDGIRTRDSWLGKPVLYQLSYIRLYLEF